MVDQVRHLVVVRLVLCARRKPQLVERVCDGARPFTRANQLIQLLIQKPQCVGRAGRNAGHYTLPAKLQRFLFRDSHDVKHLFPLCNGILVHGLEKEVALDPFHGTGQQVKLRFFSSADLLIVLHFPRHPSGRQQRQQVGRKIKLHAASPSQPQEPAAVRRFLSESNRPLLRSAGRLSRLPRPLP